MSLAEPNAIRNHVLKMAGWSTAQSNRVALVEEFVEQALREVAEANDWDELKKVGAFNTVAPYSTGTATTSGTGVTGVGTTWVSTMVGYKFSAGFGRPWLPISARGGNTSITLGTPWPWTDLAGDTYQIYEDVFSLASDVDKVFTKEVMLFDDDGRPLRRMSEAEFHDNWDLPNGTGAPQYFKEIERDTDGNIQWQLGPYAPDKVYRVRYPYKKKAVKVNDLPETLLELVSMGALKRAYQMPEFVDTDLAEREEARLQRALTEKIRTHRSQGQRSSRIKTFDEGLPTRGVNINYPVAEA